MKTVRWWLAAALLLAALTGCSLCPETATLIIQNDSSHVVDEVYIAPIDSPDMGDNWLSTTIPPGGSHPFRRINPGTYDVLINDQDGGSWPVFGLVLDPGAEIELPLTD
jgi:hypothetical protein